MKLTHILSALVLAAICQSVSAEPAKPAPAEAPAEKTKLLEPYAPKPSGPTPEGWEIQPLKGSSIESVTKLQSGKEIKVNAVAYQLVPKAGGVVLTDPGFDPKLANAQKTTIGALLTEYSEVADELQKTLEKTLAELDTALGAPPAEKKPDAAPAKPEPAKPEPAKPTTGKKPR